MNREPLFLPPLQEGGSLSTRTNLFRRLQDFFFRSQGDGSDSPSMSPLERDRLNTCDKLKRFGRIPRKLTVHLLLVLATTFMVYLWTSNDALHIRHSYGHFHRVLLGVSGTSPGDRRIEIATADDLKKQLDETVEGFWALDDSKLTDDSLCKEPLEFQVSGIGGVSSVKLFRDSWRTDSDYEKFTTDINSSVTQFTIKGTLHDNFIGPHWNQCLRWVLEPTFEYGGTGLVIGSLQYRVNECSKNGETAYLAPTLVIILAVLSAVLCTRTQMRARFSSKWYMFNVTANVLQVLAALSCLRLVRRMDISYRFTLIGLAALTSWVCVLRYLRYFHIYYVLVRTLSRAVPKCIRFVTGVSPILIGYALLGNCLFYQSPMFTTIGGSIATLFSLLNGDIIRDTFTDVGQLFPFWGEVYLYSFLCLFIYVVLHIFISIVEEAYFSAKRYSENLEDDDAASVGDNDNLEFVLETNDSIPTATSSHSNLDEYVLSNVKSQLLLLKELHKLDPNTKTQLLYILNS